jgi:hypothetical protein
LFYPLLLFWGFLGFGMAMVIVSLQIGIGEYVNFLVILMTVILIYFLILKLTGIHFPEKWIDLTTAIVFLHPISLVFILQ